MIWHCELQCCYCPASNFRQTSHLRTHVRERHAGVNQFPELEVLPGKLGNEGKYPTECHKPRKPQDEVRSEQAAEATSAGQKTRKTLPKQLPLPDTPALLGEPQTRLGQSLAYANTSSEDVYGKCPARVNPGTVDLVSPAMTCFSEYHSASMSRDPSFASQSIYEQAFVYQPPMNQNPMNQPAAHQVSMIHQQFSRGVTYSTEVVPTTTGTVACYPPGYRPAKPYRSLPISPSISETPAVLENQPMQAQFYSEDSQDMLPQTAPADMSTYFAPSDNFQPANMAQFGMDGAENQQILAHLYSGDSQAMLPQTASADTAAFFTPSDSSPHNESTLQLTHMEQSMPMQLQEVILESSATTEALLAIDTKMDEFLDLVTSAQKAGANVEILKARLSQGFQDIERKIQLVHSLTTVQD
ncbi:hypothetical protein IWX49DRAFT_117846 [Phyllosticta citricarpa]|uniref:C2H2-type domain-containing protein n=2 Tax=Phyllosticta TaxID=121621 RepID=A0ABR1MEC0_9PEZI